MVGTPGVGVRAGGMEGFAEVFDDFHDGESERRGMINPQLDRARRDAKARLTR